MVHMGLQLPLEEQRVVVVLRVEMPPQVFPVAQGVRQELMAAVAPVAVGTTAIALCVGGTPLGRGETVEAVRFASFGPEQLAHSHPLV